MTETLPTAGVALRSLIASDGRLRLSLMQAPVVSPADDEVVIRMTAAPVNPSDLGMLLGPTDPQTLALDRTVQGPEITGAVPQARLASVAARLDSPMAVGNEGAGLVVETGSDARALLGRKVAVFGGAMFAQYRTIAASDCLLLPDETTPAEAASAFVNPMTALGMVETLKTQGHTGLVHTAAASNLGQMLNRLCLKDGIPLVNIVRSPDQAAILRQIGAVHVCDSTAATFIDDLTEAVAAAGATLAFDAVGGGLLAGQILGAMEVAAGRKPAAYSRYGSTTFKQVYIYGGLNTGPTEIARTFGMAWSAGGWLLTTFMATLSPERLQALKARIADELTTTFASRYTAEVTLEAFLDPALLAQAARRATGEKILIDLAGS